MNWKKFWLTLSVVYAIGFNVMANKQDEFAVTIEAQRPYVFEFNANFGTLDPSIDEWTIGEIIDLYLDRRIDPQRILGGVWIGIETSNGYIRYLVSESSLLDYVPKGVRFGIGTFKTLLEEIDTTEDASKIRLIDLIRKNSELEYPDLYRKLNLSPLKYPGSVWTSMSTIHKMSGLIKFDTSVEMNPRLKGLHDAARSLRELKGRYHDRHSILSEGVWLKAKQFDPDGSGEIVFYPWDQALPRDLASLGPIEVYRLNKNGGTGRDQFNHPPDVIDPKDISHKATTPQELFALKHLGSIAKHYRFEIVPTSSTSATLSVDDSARRVQLSLPSAELELYESSMPELSAEAYIRAMATNNDYVWISRNKDPLTRIRFRKSDPLPTDIGPFLKFAEGLPVERAARDGLKAERERFPINLPSQIGGVEPKGSPPAADAPKSFAIGACFRAFKNLLGLKSST